jgi:hypothetical protein
MHLLIIKIAVSVGNTFLLGTLRKLFHAWKWRGHPGWRGQHEGIAMTDAEVDMLAQVVADLPLSKKQRSCVTWDIVGSGLNLNSAQISRFLKVAEPTVDPFILHFLDQAA